MNIEEIKDFGTRKTGLNAPEGYFADFDKRMNALIDAESESTSLISGDTDINKDGTFTPKISLFTQIKPWLYLAATFISFVVLFKVIFAPEQQNSSLMADYTYDTAVEDAIYSSVNDYDIFEYLYAENEY